MSLFSSLRYLYLANFSKPAAQRTLVRAIRQTRPSRIVELGVKDGQRSRRIIDLAAHYVQRDQIRYTGIDLFEARPAEAPGITIKLAHRMLKPLAGHVQLIPGDPFMALSRMANSLTETDLVIIGADQDAASTEKAWFYVPRMLSERANVFHEFAEGDINRYELVSLPEITKLADQTAQRRRQAA